MKKKNEGEDIKIDLKHDNMEFSAPPETTQINKRIDSADIYKEEDEEDITSDELDLIETDDVDEAYALNSVETDILQDDDNLPEEDWTEDLPDNDEEEDDEEEKRRR